jgi:hypothetical protein
VPALLTSTSSRPWSAARGRRGPARPRVADVGLQVGAADLRRDGLPGLDRGTGVDDDVAAVGGQAARDLRADAGGAAGDQGDLLRHAAEPTDRALPVGGGQDRAVTAAPLDTPALDEPPLDPPPVDALLLVSFGGPEGPDDVLPFMQNVTRGRDIPAARLEEVSRHYLDLFGGVSPINQQARDLKATLEAELAARGPDLPVYWGNRNWHPFFTEAVTQMRDDGVRHALAVVTSAFPSYSGCRQYREDWWRARAEVGDGAPLISKLRHYWAEDGFLRRWPGRRRPPSRHPARGWSSPRTPSHLHGRQQRPPDVDGAYVAALREARPGSSSGWRRVRVGPGLPVAQRPPQVPWLEPTSATTCWRCTPRASRGGDGPDRLHQRPRRGAVRPRPAGAGAGGRAARASWPDARPRSAPTRSSWRCCATSWPSGWR